MNPFIQWRAAQSRSSACVIQHALRCPACLHEGVGRSRAGTRGCRRHWSAGRSSAGPRGGRRQWGIRGEVGALFKVVSSGFGHEAEQLGLTCGVKSVPIHKWNTISPAHNQPRQCGTEHCRASRPGNSVGRVEAVTSNSSSMMLNVCAHAPLQLPLVCAHAPEQLSPA